MKVHAEIHALDLSGLEIGKSSSALLLYHPVPYTVTHILTHRVTYSIDR